jgi:hypothetical protein
MNAMTIVGIAEKTALISSDGAAQNDIRYERR